MTWDNAIRNFSIQEIYRSCSLENCNKLPENLIDFGKRWIKHPRRPSLYIQGNTGSGKTYFSTCLFRALLENYYNWIIFVRSDDLDFELLNAIENKQEKSILQKYCEVPALFIDDLGVERPSDRVIRQYYSIIDKRVGDGLLTVITSNISKKDLPLGDRTVSRLEHFLSIEFPKKDLRKTLEILCV